MPIRKESRTPSREHLASREPTVEDLRDLCRELNRGGANYVVVGGFAIRAAGYIRSTMDVDLVVAADAENEARVFAAIASPRMLWRMKAVTHREKERRT